VCVGGLFLLPRLFDSLQIVLSRKMHSVTLHALSQGDLTVRHTHAHTHTLCLPALALQMRGFTETHTAPLLVTLRTCYGSSLITFLLVTLHTTEVD
jgi:hypothetical protein